MKIIKDNLKLFIGVLMGGIIFWGLGVAFASTFLAKDVTYTPNDETFNVSDVEGALDKLYQMEKKLGAIESAECVSGSFVCEDGCVGTTGQKLFDF